MVGIHLFLYIFHTMDKMMYVFRTPHLLEIRLPDIIRTILATQCLRLIFHCIISIGNWQLGLLVGERWFAMIHENKHSGKFRSTESDIVLKNDKTLFAVRIDFLK